jgi:hypothetical protein
VRGKLDFSLVSYFQINFSGTMNGTANARRSPSKWHHKDKSETMKAESTLDNRSYDVRRTSQE